MRTRSCESLGAAALALVGLAAALLFATPATAQLLVLRNGEQQAGRLSSCSATSCRLDGVDVAVSEIEWILLDEARSIPADVPAASIDQVRLRNGTVHQGAFVGLSLGLVVLGEERHDRTTVVAVRFATLVAASAHAPPDEAEPVVDAVAMRDGTVHLGELETCIGGSCLLIGVGALARADVAAIAFGGAERMPTTTNAPLTTDRLIPRSGPHRDGPIHAIDPDEVFAASGRHERRTVAAVLFVEQLGESSGGTPNRDAGSTEPAPNTDDAADLPPPQSGLAPQPDGAGPGTSGARWRGTIEGRTDKLYEGYTHTQTFHVEMAFSEQRTPLMIEGQLAYEQVQLMLDSLSVDERYDESQSDGTVCLGTAQATAADGSPVGSMLIRHRDLALPGGQASQVPVGSATYSLSVIPVGPQQIEYLCQPPGRDAWSGTVGFASWDLRIGRRLDVEWYASTLNDPKVRWVADGRMRGSFSFANETGTHHSSASWSFCREGVDCPPPASAPPGESTPFDPCGRSGQQRALADTCQAQLDAMVAALAPHLAEYGAKMDAAQRNSDAFEQSQDWCEVYDRGTDLLEAILTGGAGRAAEAGRALLYLRDLIVRVQNGTLGELLYPSQVKTFLKHFKTAKAMWFELTADDLSKMQRDHDACAGKAPLEIRERATQFLRDLAAAKQVWESKVAPGLNDLRSKGYECASLNHEAWRACQSDAECRGEAPSCGPEPSLDSVSDLP